jgi:3-oxoacyl-[acyl-carrier-protein] synthase II
MSTRFAVSGWSAVSPFGIGADAFRDGVRTGRSAVRELSTDDWQVPAERAGLVPSFDIRTVLGRKNTRSMDRATGLAVSSVGMLLEGHEADLRAATDRTVGLVLGTTTGSVQSMMDFTRDSLTQDKPFHVDPARFPNTVMNCAAGQCAIWYGLRGPNTTIAGGQATGLLALNYAARLLRRGHADVLLWGAVEEFSTQRAWLEWHANGVDVPLGEGCTIFLLEPLSQARAAGRPVLAELLGLRCAVYGGAVPAADMLATCAGQLLQRSLVAPDDVWAVAVSDYPDDRAEAQREGLRRVFGGHEPRLLSVTGLLGDTASASAAFQFAELLSVAEDDPAARGRTALVTSLDREGVVACALVRLP